MPVCQNCSKAWTWKQTIKSLFRLRCPHCDTKQYESAASRKRGSLFVIIPIIVIPINMLFDISLGTAITLAVIIALIIMSFYPFLLKLSNEEEPYF